MPRPRKGGGRPRTVAVRVSEEVFTASSADRENLLFSDKVNQVLEYLYLRREAPELRELRRQHAELRSAIEPTLQRLKLLEVQIAQAESDESASSRLAEMVDALRPAWPHRQGMAAHFNRAWVKARLNIESDDMADDVLRYLEKGGEV